MLGFVDRLKDVEHKQDDQNDQQNRSDTYVHIRPPLVCFHVFTAYATR
jgi:hypothetical protein